MKFFKVFFKNNSGRNNQGNITILSKGRKIKKSSIFLKINISKLDKSIFCITSIFRSKNRVFCFNKHILGSISIRPYIEGTDVGQKNFNSNLPQKYWLNNLPGNVVILKYLNKHNLCCNIFINNLRKYATSNGTFCQIIDIFNDFNLVKLLLPSKKTKIISGWNFTVLGRNGQINKKYDYLGKAGTNINNGIKPKVRGVARNPVDHPHGGRTKTNQPEVSIWGWIAKKNK